MYDFDPLCASFPWAFNCDFILLEFVFLFLDLGSLMSLGWEIRCFVAPYLVMTGGLFMASPISLIF